MGAAVIAGLGMTDLGKVYGRSPRRFAADATRLAVADAGLTLADVDGLIVSSGLSGSPSIELADALGLHDLSLLTHMTAFGATAGAMVAYAAMAVGSGAADVVACVFADAPLWPDRPAGAAYRRDTAEYRGLDGMRVALGFGSVNDLYALAARRHMERYGTTSEQLGAVAVATRQWAASNPRAQMRDPITLADHQASRWVTEPLHLLDCCLVSNGGVAVVVTSADRARDLPRPPVHIWGWGQGHPGHRMERGSDFGLTTGAATSGPAALKMAGVTVDDVDMCQIYDCYTYTVVVTLEDYGFCPKGEGGAFAASGALGPGGSLPTNTGGGQLSGYYMWGMTPVSEAVMQARGERRAGAGDIIMVSGNGGILAHHSTLILSPPENIMKILRDDRSAPFFDGAARDVLMIRRCPACASYHPPEASACPCGAEDLDWVPAAGSGTLVSFAGPPERLLAIVELAEGPWVFGRLVASAAGAGQALRVVFVHPDEGESYPLWEVSGADARV